ncbi:MAG: hypothetical protein JOY62_03055 [Acidobacteriaceae bacterium]|nr:hypothetical protein [Acidobacteriaceae bacterium]MBV9778929.1 hypothetical protein [Acidobacteriaceae bacterium]
MLDPNHAFNSSVSVPGRVNLIGEHIDYHDLPVLPIAIQRRISIAFRARNDASVHAASSGYGERQFTLNSQFEPGPPGDWANYLKAAAQAANCRWTLERGIDAAITSDLPPAAGLSSSSALLTGFTLALLRANGIRATFDELMDVLPQAEHFVGTRGGGMDHAAVLQSEAGCALLINFAPLKLSPIPIPEDWCFLIGHSLTSAEKSGAMRAEYNARRTIARRAVQQLGFESFRSAIENRSLEALTALAAQGAADGRLNALELDYFLHVVSESFRVSDAVTALLQRDGAQFGKLLSASHASLRDRLRVSSAALDELVDGALKSGALGARLTGAGFGGCVVILCEASDCDRVRGHLVRNYYSRHSADFDPDKHLFAAKPSAGALNE